MSWAEIAAITDLVARSVALAGAAFAGIVALTHWAVRARKLPPFGAVSRTMRSLSDPFLRPIERMLVRRGANPQDATVWFLGITVVAGLLLVTLARWLFRAAAAIVVLGDASPRALAQVGINVAFSVVMGAIFVRVISSWFGASPHSKWMRPVRWLTEWIIAPIRRIVPPVAGVIDLSPIVAYFALVLLRAFVLAIFLDAR